MGPRRRHLFVLLFVLGLVIVSAVVIVSKPTTLGLDLKGGVELVLQAQADPPAADGHRQRDGPRSRHHPRRLRPARRLRDRGLACRQRPDPGRHPRRDQRRQGNRVRDEARPALLLRLGVEPDRPRGSDRRPPRPQPPPAALKAAEKEWKDAGRDPKKTINKQLIFAGALPTEYDAAKLASEQELVKDCPKVQRADHLLPVRQGQGPHADRRPRVHRRRPLHRAQRPQIPA